MNKRLVDFGIRIRVLREKRQLTLEAMANQAGIDAAALGLIERGQRDPRLSTMLKIADGLGIQLHDIFGSKK